jgi:hypothetical protein
VLLTWGGGDGNDDGVGDGNYDGGGNGDGDRVTDIVLPVARHLLSSCSLLADSAAKELI